MSQLRPDKVRPDKDEITRASMGFELDQAILLLAVAIGVGLLSMWVAGTSRDAGVTAFMLNKKRVETIGYQFVYTPTTKEFILGYHFEDQKGKEWFRIKKDALALAGKAYRRAKRNQENPKKVGDIQKSRPITVFYHPDYPRFFATEAELSGFIFSFWVMVGAMAVFLLSIYMGLRSVKKYRELKAVAAYYH